MVALQADPMVAAQVAKDNEARAIQLAMRTAKAYPHDDLLRRREECLYWTTFRSFADDDTEAAFQAGIHRDLDGVAREIRRRLALLSAVVHPLDSRAPRPTNSGLTDLAQRVKQVLTVSDALADLGFEPKRTGSSGGREEWHSSCPFCGGDDRFISWGHPDSNWFCRECREGGDIVTLAEKVLGVSAAEAIRRLARLARVPV